MHDFSNHGAILKLPVGIKCCQSSTQGKGLSTFESGQSCTRAKLYEGKACCELKAGMFHGAHCWLDSLPVVEFLGKNYRFSWAQISHVLIYATKFSGMSHDEVSIEFNTYFMARKGMPKVEDPIVTDVWKDLLTLE